MNDPLKHPTAKPVFYRSYSRKNKGISESWQQMCDRTVAGLVEVGKFTSEEEVLIRKYFDQVKALPSGRWMWVGGTEWLSKPENWSGAYNCTSTEVVDWDAFGLMMDLAMMGSGTGAILEPQFISQLPPIRNTLNIEVTDNVGVLPPHQRLEETFVFVGQNAASIVVGDSRKGWVKAYQTLMEISSDASLGQEIDVKVDLSSVRPSGEKLQGFGGTANPVRLKEMFFGVAKVLNGAVGRQLNSVECCLIIDHGANAVVAGNIRRSAGMRQGASNDELFAVAKDNLWQQDAEGNWRIDPDRDVLRMANHTIVFHRQPTEQECIESVRKQFYSGEGAIQYAPEAIARSNADILNTSAKKAFFLDLYNKSPGVDAIRYLEDCQEEVYGHWEAAEIQHRLNRYGLNPCFRGDMKLLTVDGYKSFVTLDNTEPLIVNASGEVSRSRVWCSGIKDVVRLKLTTKDEIVCTPDHVFETTSGEFQANECKGRQLMPYLQKPALEAKTILLGFIQGDGNLTRLQSEGFAGIEVNIGRHDKDILSIIEEVGLAYKWHGDRVVYISGLNDTLKALKFSGAISPDRVLPETYEDWETVQKAAFLNGLYSANGSVVGSRITFKTTSKNLADQLVDTLEKDFGIEAYTTTNKAKPVAFANGVYRCRESYDVNIQQYQSRLIFFNRINFSLEYKTEKLSSVMIEGAPTVRAILDGGKEKVYDFTEPKTHWGVVNGFVAHNCGEIIGANFHCNLAGVQLNQLDPFNFQEQEEAFTVAALSVAALLNRGFVEPRYQKSRELDPIVGVSFTGLFDFFVHAFGVDWLRWWEAGRPDEWKKDQGRVWDLIGEIPAMIVDPVTLGDGYVKRDLAEIYRLLERGYLRAWRYIATQAVWKYCDLHNLKRPNRCTTVQPEGSRSLLSGASCGWHPPKAQRYIRRITFGKNDPVALACIDYGYSVVPAQSDKDENGNLLNDPFDPRCTEWLVEIPVEVPWANLPGADEIAIEKFSALAQFSFYMQVQRFYTTHNASATIELRENEIEPLGTRIYQAIQNNEGYISTALLARFDDLQTFPRLPFEPISKEKFEELSQAVLDRRKTDDFLSSLNSYMTAEKAEVGEYGATGCDSDKCMLPLTQPN